MSAIDVFISYRRLADRTPLARRLAVLLRNHGFSVWWDQGLGAGFKFEDEILRAIDDASVVIPLWCSQSVYSPWVLRECQLGNQKLVPAKLQNVSPPPSFAHVHAEDLVGWTGNVNDTRLTELIKAVARQAEKSGSIARDTTDELSLLPAVAALPAFDEKADRLLQRFRNAFLRQDELCEISEALRINLDSPLSELLGEYETTEQAHDLLCDFCSTAGEDSLIWRSPKELLVYPDDFEAITTLGEMIDHLISNRDEDYSS